MAEIRQLVNENGIQVMPVTVLEAIYDENGKQIFNAHSHNFG